MSETGIFAVILVGIGERNGWGNETRGFIVRCMGFVRRGRHGEEFSFFWGKKSKFAVSRSNCLERASDR